MPKISDGEVRRLLSHLKSYVDEEQLAEIEDELRGNDAEEFLREPDLLKHFPELFDEFTAAGKNWKLRVIPHAHLRMVQRSVKLNDTSAFFRSFAELYTADERPIFIGHYALYGRMQARNLFVTVRVDVSSITDEKGGGHVVTVANVSFLFSSISELSVASTLALHKGEFKMVGKWWAKELKGN